MYVDAHARGMYACGTCGHEMQLPARRWSRGGRSSVDLGMAHGVHMGPGLVNERPPFSSPPSPSLARYTEADVFSLFAERRTGVSTPLQREFIWCLFHTWSTWCLAATLGMGA